LALPRQRSAVTTLPYIEESAAVDDIVKLLKGELTPMVKIRRWQGEWVTL
jgi:hypothetical protein